MPLPLSAEESRFLSDMAFDAVVGWENSAIGKVGVDRGLDGKPLRFRTGAAFAYYEKGLCAHADSRLTFDVAGLNAVRLTAVIGVHDGDNSDAKDAANVLFIVKADEEEIYRSGSVRINTGNIPISVDIPLGTGKLYLITAGVDSIRGAHSAWADAKLFFDPDAGDYLQSITATADKAVFALSETARITVAGIMAGGGQADLSKADIRYTCSDDTVLTAGADGVLTPIRPGAASVTAAVTLNGVTKRDTMDFIITGERQDTMWQVFSPDNNTQLVLMLGPDGSLQYSAAQNGEVVIRLSSLGIQSGRGDFSAGLAFQGQSKPTEIRDVYTVASRKKKVYVNHAHECTYTFQKGDMLFQVIVRVYDDGVAFRYVIESLDHTEQSLRITGEQTGFTVPRGANTWAMIHDSGNIFSYESDYLPGKIEVLNGNYCLPFLYETKGGAFVLLCEADLTGDYAGSMLKTSGDGILRYSFTPQQKTAVTVKTPFTSPWRYAVIGDLAATTVNTMAENLSPEPPGPIGWDGDFSWVEPGTAAWTWMVGGAGMQGNQADTKKYIDFAAEMGWRYYILDDGWQPNRHENGTGPNGALYTGVRAWFPDIIEYAEQKGVGIIVWVHCNDLRTQALRDERLPVWAGMGIQGVKVDFFESEAQDRIKLYNDIYRDCARHKLVMNLHGANKPTGEVRTYPHALTREAIRGQEYSDVHGHQLATLPFTRSAVGPGDFTEALVPAGKSDTTTGAQMAISVLLQNGMHVMAGSAESYRSSNAYTFYKDFPAVWDETKLLDGYPGEFAVMARRRGNVWYGGAVTVAPRTAGFDLRFLGEGSYTAYIYQEGAAARGDVVLRQTDVTRMDTLTIAMQANGGCAIKLVPENDQPAPSDAVTELLMALPDTITAQDQVEQVEHARDAFDRLSIEEQLKVPKLLVEKLERLEKQLNPDPVVYGDVNGSGGVDIGDARLVLQHLVGKIALTPEQFDRAAVREAGRVEISDARLILQFLVGKIQAFPRENVV